tara:strand:- start:782 stop:1099 length:318 start_codon:yes stop_codon:yes gene_type:complete
MYKLIINLLFIPLIGFGQNSNRESKFNFKKSNNYKNVYSYKNDKKSEKKQNDSISKHIFYSQEKNSYSPFNKGLIHFLSKAMQKGIDGNPSILKKRKKKNDIEEK